jgi:hypothetical protein
MLHRFGHGLLVVLVACLSLMPVRTEAAPIELGTVSSGNFAISGVFGADNDVALIFLSLFGTAVVSAEITSHLDAVDPGFDPILTLLGPGTDFLGDYDYLFDASEGFIEAVTLSAGNYVLALTQYHNYYFPGAGFEYAAAVNGRFTYDFFAVDADGDGVPDTPCSAFVAFDGGCRSPNFAGTLSVQPEDVVQPVPEPGSLFLLMAGGAALLARPRGWRRPDASDRA